MGNAVVRTWLVYVFTLLMVAALNIDGVSSWYASKGEGGAAIRTGLATVKDLHTRTGIGPWLTSLECAAGPVFEGSYKDKSKCLASHPEPMVLARLKPGERIPDTALKSAPNPNPLDEATTGSRSKRPHEDDRDATPRQVMHEPDGAVALPPRMEPQTQHPLGEMAAPSECARPAVAPSAWGGSGLWTVDDREGVSDQPGAGEAVRFDVPHAPPEDTLVEVHRSAPTAETLLHPPQSEEPSGPLKDSRVRTASLHSEETVAPPDASGAGQELCDESMVRTDFRSVLLVGDSLAHGLALALGRDLKDRTGAVFSFVAKVSSGLNNPNVFNWERTIRLLIEQGPPDLILVMMGVNDANNHIRDGNRLCPVGTSEWAAAYQDKVENFLRIAAEFNIRVRWIGVPVVREEGLQNRVLLANMAARNACSRVSHCRFIDTFEALCDENRRYTNYIKEPDGSAIRIRAKDGIHFSMEGSNLLSRYILQKLETGDEAPPSARN